VHVRSLEAVEGGGGGHSVSTHVVKDQPVTHLQVGQVTLLNDAVEAVASRAPDTARVHDLIRLWLLIDRKRGEAQKSHFVSPPTDSLLQPISVLTLCSVGKQ